MIVPLFVGREKSVRALEAVMKDDKQILLASQKDASEDEPKAESIYRTGVLANVLQLLKLPDGTVKVLVEGKARVRITDFLPNDAYFEAEAHEIAETDGRPGGDQGAGARGRRGVRALRQAQPQHPRGGGLGDLRRDAGAAKLADTVAGHLGAKLEEKQKLLEQADVGERLEAIYGLMQGEMCVLKVEKKIKSRVKTQMERTQREYYLNEQMKAIQRELGGEGEGQDDASEFEERIAKTKLSKEAARQGDRRAEEAALDVADVGRGHGGAQLPRVDAVDPLGQEVEDQEGSRTSPRRCSTTTTTGWRRSRTGSWSSWRCSRARTS